jgi:hypothetical protein
MSMSTVSIVGFLQFHWNKIVERFGNCDLHNKVHYVDPLTLALQTAYEYGPIKECRIDLVMVNNRIFQQEKWEVVLFHRSSEVAIPGQIDVITFVGSPFTVGLIDDEGGYVYHKVDMVDRELRIPAHHWRCLLFFEPASLVYTFSSGEGNLIWEVGAVHFIKNQ